MHWLTFFCFIYFLNHSSLQYGLGGGGGGSGCNFPYMTIEDVPPFSGSKFEQGQDFWVKLEQNPDFWGRTWSRSYIFGFIFRITTFKDQFLGIFGKILILEINLWDSFQKRDETVLFRLHFIFGRFQFFKNIKSSHFSWLTEFTPLQFKFLHFWIYFFSHELRL